jgi:crotonobetainyl-CoA:carnitine CoA-transferase CaiB-like acyl-CoA transferase
MKLDGIRVLDLSRFLPGPYVGQMMADHGAEVIKVESHEGEPTRRLGPEINGHPAYFRNTQRGKLSLRLNLKAEEGLEIFLRLAQQTDVIIESFRPGVVDRLGIGYGAVRERNPGIVYCSLSAFGQTGPHAERPSHDLGAQALTGVLSLGRHGGAAASAMPTLPMADIALGSAALIGILMALFRRQQTKAGDFIDAAMVDTLMSWTPHILSSVLHDGKPPDLGRERLHGGAAFYNIYRTADDRYIVLSGAEMNFVENLLNALGRPDLIELCRRPWGPEQDPVKEFLAGVFATRTRDEWDAWLRDRGVCYAPVLDIHEAWHQPGLRERGVVVTGEDGVEHLGTPIRFAAEPGQPTGRVPGLGEHTDMLLQRLGYDQTECRRLKKAGVC